MQMKFWLQAILIVGITNTIYLVSDTITRHKSHVPAMNDEFTCHFDFMHIYYPSWHHQKILCFLHPKSSAWYKCLHKNQSLDASTHRRKYQKLSFRKPKCCRCSLLWHGTRRSYVIPFPQHLCTVQKITKLPLIKTIICLTLGIWSMVQYLIYCTLLKLFLEDRTSDFFVNSMVQLSAPST